MVISYIHFLNRIKCFRLRGSTIIEFCDVAYMIKSYIDAHQNFVKRFIKPILLQKEKVVQLENDFKTKRSQLKNSNAQMKQKLVNASTSLSDLSQMDCLM